MMMEKESQYKRESQTGYQPEQHVQDVNNREIFKNNRLVSQFLRNYTDIPLFANVEEEDVEDVTQKYHAFLGVDFESDTVKKVMIRNTDGTLQREIYVISLIEHKSSVDYDVAMQLLRYMSMIWYECKAAHDKQRQGSSERKSFRYPLIIPIVYYEGKRQWTAEMHLKDRIDYVAGTEKYIPDFQYELAGPGKYTYEELSKKQDEMALAMLMNKIQSEDDLQEFRGLPEKVVNTIYGNAPEEIRKIYERILWALLMKMKVPNEEAEDIVEHVRGGRSMGYLFENMDEIDIQAQRRKTQKQRELAEEARKEAEAAQKEAEAAQKEAEAAQKEAEAAQKEAEAAQKEAEMAREETKEAKRKVEAVEQERDAMRKQLEEYKRQYGELK